MKKSPTSPLPPPPQRITTCRYCSGHHYDSLDRCQGCGGPKSDTAIHQSQAGTWGMLPEFEAMYSKYHTCSSGPR